MKLSPDQDSNQHAINLANEILKAPERAPKLAFDYIHRQFSDLRVEFDRDEVKDLYIMHYQAQERLNRK